ncbi:MAG: hypothetical protein WC384_19165 [Prolixibacteraceae bacterium]
MKRFSVFAFMTICLFTNLLAQEPDKKSNSPRENSTVKREYDDKGNLIRFDSTYTYSWSGDTTLLNSLSPDNFPDPFSGHFGLTPDSTFKGNSFFDEFKQFFAQPSWGQDSDLMRNFGIHPHFHEFHLNGDSTAMNFPDFDELFQYFSKNKNDSTSSGTLEKGEHLQQPGSMNEMMKMIQEQMKAMEEQHRKFFDDQQKRKSF